MLHVILGILKWIGILILTLLAVLVIPVRYQGSAVKTPERLEGRIQATWLLHAISVQLLLSGKATKPELEIKLFNQTLSWWSAHIGKRRQRKRKKKAKRAAAQKEEKRKQRTEARSRSNSQEKPLESQEKCEASNQEKPLESQEKYEAPNSEKYLESQKEREASNQGKTLEDKTEHKAEHKTQKKNPKSGRALGTEARDPGSEKKESIIQKLLQRIRDAIQTGRKLAEKIRNLLHRPEEIQQFLEEYEIADVWHIVKTELAGLARHYRPRHLRGYLKFGTGDPALTGKLTGACYLLLPTREYEILPNFEESMFETETEFSGRIRSIHLLLAGYRLIREKKIKRLIRKVRKKGDSQNG